ETEALRTEAELGAARCYAGQAEQGMATLDSVIVVLGTMPTFKFNELDAFIIASKRKIGVLSSTGRYVETLPLARRIIERLEDYEAHPDQYADDSKRVPADSASRASYINFYRTQAQGYISAAYTALGQSDNMTDAYLQIERSVTEMTAREHIARYNALQQQMETERERAASRRVTLVAGAVAISALLAIAFGIYALRTSRAIRRKNRVLVREISESLDYKQKYEHLENVMKQRAKTDAPVRASQVFETAEQDLEQLSDADLFQYLSHAIRHEKMYLEPHFERQMLVERFHISAHRIGAAFTQGSSHSSLPDFIRSLRIEHACQLLREHPEMTITEVAEQSGFSNLSVFSRNFKSHIQMTPTEFQRLNANLIS
ncbi:MAG: AraC family transcriptional regulator, partial [Prevotella sp.]|nr:AraC family transcriptional regulator [Prevotella sp.]